MNAITKIQKDSVSELVYDQLRENIITGHWLPNDKIPSENQLADLFGVSRVSVRVAIKKMITLGLLESRVGEGTYVKEFDPSVCLNELAPLILKPKNQMEILEFRKALETEVIRLAVERASDQEIRELERIYQKMCKASETSNLDEYFNLDGQFHQCLFDMSKNSLFIGIFQILSQLLLTHYQATVKKSWEVDGVPAVVQDDEHYNIVMGLKERNVELAVDTYVTMIDAKIAMFSMQEFRHS